MDCLSADSPPELDVLYHTTGCRRNAPAARGSLGIGKAEDKGDSSPLVESSDEGGCKKARREGNNVAHSGTGGNDRSRRLAGTAGGEGEGDKTACGAKPEWGSLYDGFGKAFHAIISPVRNP